MNAVEQVDWVDEDGQTLESVSRPEMRRRNLLHRVTATFVFHPDGRVYVHQRSHLKDVYPTLYDPCVGGTVVSGESYPANVCRELAEELGIEGVPVYPLFGHRFQDAATNSLIRAYACVTSGPFRLQADEVQDGRWCAEESVDALIAGGQVCPDSAKTWARYLAQHGRGRNFAREVAPELEAFKCEAVLGMG